ncbi:MAG: hypothetical protein RIQ81_2194 [Pseudomonadota bacterium]
MRLNPTLIAATVTTLLELAAGAAAFGQSDAEEPAGTAQTVIDDGAFPSARAAALGGSIASMADDIDAAGQNPAGIGGFGFGKNAKLPLARKVYFPHISLGANANSYSLHRSARKQEASDDPALAKSLLGAADGKRQYFRNHVSMGMIVGRFLLLPYYDQQLAAVGTADETGQVSSIATRYRTRSGFAFGGSFTDPKGMLSIGFMSNTFNQSDVEGDATYEQIIEKSKRNAFIEENSKKYSATDNSVGMMWRISEKFAPTLGVTLQHSNGTRYQTSTEGAEPFTQEQDMTIGFSVTPKNSGDVRISLCVEADRLMQDEVTVSKKLHTGAEMRLGTLPGSYAGVALRVGYESAGPSMGLFLNGGLLNVEISSRAVDIGSGNDRVIERRLNGTAFVNVAEF